MPGCTEARLLRVQLLVYFTMGRRPLSGFLFIFLFKRHLPSPFFCTLMTQGQVGRSDTGVYIGIIANISQRGTQGASRKRTKRGENASRGSWPVDGGSGPPLARCMTRLALLEGGQRFALPHSRLMSKGRSRLCPTFCAWGRQAPMAKFGRLEHLAKVTACKSDIQDCCFGGSS